MPGYRVYNGTRMDRGQHQRVQLREISRGRYGVGP